MITLWQISEIIWNASLALGTETATSKSLRHCVRSWATQTIWVHCNATGSERITILVYSKCLNFSWTIRLLTDSIRVRLTSSSILVSMDQQSFCQMEIGR